MLKKDNLAAVDVKVGRCKRHDRVWAALLDVDLDKLMASVNIIFSRTEMIRE